MSRKEYIQALVGGVLACLLVVKIFVMFASPVSSQLFALFLAYTACVYFGSALSDSRLKWISVEFLMSVPFFVFAALGLLFSPVWLGIGYIVHGLWDTLHHPKVIKTKVIKWFPPACAIFDFIVAAYIFTFF